MRRDSRRKNHYARTFLRLVTTEFNRRTLFKGAAGAVGAASVLTGEASDLAKMFGTFEQAHVDALIKALQDANYANIAKEGTYKFPTFDTQDNILKFLNVVEPVGVGTYTGAAKLIKDKSIFGVAGSIVQVEARQLAITQQLAGNKTPVSGPLSENFTVDDVNAKVKPLIG